MNSNLVHEVNSSPQKQNSISAFTMMKRKMQLTRLLAQKELIMTFEGHSKRYKKKLRCSDEVWEKNLVQIKQLHDNIVVYFKLAIEEVKEAGFFGGNKVCELVYDWNQLVEKHFQFQVTERNIFRSAENIQLKDFQKLFGGMTREFLGKVKEIVNGKIPTLYESQEQDEEQEQNDDANVRQADLVVQQNARKLVPVFKRKSLLSGKTVCSLKTIDESDFENASESESDCDVQLSSSYEEAKHTATQGVSRSIYDEDDDCWSVSSISGGSSVSTADNSSLDNLSDHEHTDIDVCSSMIKLSEPYSNTQHTDVKKMQRVSSSPNDVTQVVGNIPTNQTTAQRVDVDSINQKVFSLTENFQSQQKGNSANRPSGPVLNKVVDKANDAKESVDLGQRSPVDQSQTNSSQKESQRTAKSSQDTPVTSLQSHQNQSDSNKKQDQKQSNPRVQQQKQQVEPPLEKVERNSPPQRGDGLNTMSVRVESPTKTFEQIINPESLKNQQNQKISEPKENVSSTNNQKNSVANKSQPNAKEVDSKGKQGQRFNSRQSGLNVDSKSFIPKKEFSQNSTEFYKQNGNNRANKIYKRKQEENETKKLSSKKFYQLIIKPLYCQYKVDRVKSERKIDWQQYHDRNIGKFLRKYYKQEASLIKSNQVDQEGSSSKKAVKDHATAGDDTQSAQNKAEPSNVESKFSHSRKSLSKQDFQRWIISPLSKEFDILSKTTQQKISWMRFYGSRIKGAVRKYFKSEQTLSQSSTDQCQTARKQQQRYRVKQDTDSQLVAKQRLRGKNQSRPKKQEKSNLTDPKPLESKTFQLKLFQCEQEEEQKNSTEQEQQTNPMPVNFDSGKRQAGQVNQNLVQDCDQVHDQQNHTWSEHLRLLSRLLTMIETERSSRPKIDESQLLEISQMVSEKLKASASDKCNKVPGGK